MGGILSLAILYVQLKVYLSFHCTCASFSKFTTVLTAVFAAADCALCLFQSYFRGTLAPAVGVDEKCKEPLLILDEPLLCLQNTANERLL